MKSSIIIFLFLFCYFYSIQCEDPKVKTTSGPVIGQTIHVLDEEIDEFLNIPYAEPPIGKLRFAKTQPLKEEKDLIDGREIGNSCMQNHMVGIFKNLNISEDCLVLNIWAPKQDTNVTLKLPVMFWIFGGGFFAGSIFQLPMYNGSVLATQDVVFVAANYRSGHFGFLYGDTRDSPGNLGLYDQVMALEWVRNNIHNFGGDKDKITIFGESAGSFAVSALILSPLSRGLFSRAIMESGADLNGIRGGGQTPNQALTQSYQMAVDFDCQLDDQWLDCLRNVSAEDINTYTKITTGPLEGTQFLPHIAQEAKFPQEIDLIAGVTKNEGSAIAKIGRPQLQDNHTLTLKEFNQLVVSANSQYHNMDPKKIIEFYLKDVNTSDSWALKTAFYDFIGDVHIKCPTYQFARLHQKRSLGSGLGRTYFYQLTYQSSWAKILGCDEKTMGICHGSDLEFVFGTRLMTENSTQDINYQFSKDVVKMWTNFAKTGYNFLVNAQYNYLVYFSQPGYSWPELIDDDQSIVKNLNPHDINGILIDPFKNNCDNFWKDYYGVN